MIDDAISADAARRFYDRLGRRHDHADRYESRARARALRLLGVKSGERAVDIGAGTGGDTVRLRGDTGVRGTAVAVDISPVMLRLARERSGAPSVRADCRALPFRTASCDALLSAYLLDLIPLADLPDVLGEFRRVLKPGGRIALVSLTSGVTPLSRAVIRVWLALYALRPLALGGCRPVHLEALVAAAGFARPRRSVAVQLGVPSEVLVAEAP